MVNLPYKKIKVQLYRNGDPGDITEFNATEVTENLYVHKAIDDNTLKPHRTTKKIIGSGFNTKKYDIPWVITTQPGGMAVWQHCTSREQAIRLCNLIKDCRFKFNLVHREAMKQDQEVKDELYKTIIEFMRAEKKKELKEICDHHWRYTKKEIRDKGKEYTWYYLESKRIERAELCPAK